MIQEWIDAVADVFAVSDGAGGFVKSYHVYDKAEFPEAMTRFPSALTFSTALQPMYSAGGPLVDLWLGTTELHLFEDISRKHYPEIMLYFARIRNAMAASMSLGGRVAHFLPRGGVIDPIRGPVVLQYGSEAPHLGIVVQWEVKDNESGGYTVS